MYQLSKDRQQICLGILRGHERRKHEYKNTRQKLLHQCHCSGENSTGIHMYCLPQKGEEALLNLDAQPEARRIRAVETACQTIGEDIPDQEVRRRLCESILLNCKSGRDYPFELLNLTEFSRMDFYRRKHRFLYQLALNLEL